jgi:putative polyketide hydroxylase
MPGEDVNGYRYRSAAVLEEGAAPAEPDGIALLEQPLPSGLPGTRVPHLWVERQGQRVSTLDLLDGRFVLMAGPDGAAWCKAARVVAETQGIALAAYCIGGPDADLFDRENGWQAKMGISSEGALLVRPDGFVAWRSTEPEHPTKLLEHVFSRMLCAGGLLPTG